MRILKLLLVAAVYLTLLPSLSFAEGNHESQYIEATNRSGENVILKRDFVSEEQIQIEPLAGCIAFRSSASGISLAGGRSVVAYSYTTNCAGPHAASGLAKTPYNAYIRLALQKLSGGSWITVASGSSYSYSGTAGQYRIVVNNLGTVTTSTWSFNYQLPL